MIPDLTSVAEPITDEEIKSEVRKFEDYVQSFTYEMANEHLLQYVVVVNDGKYDAVNLDRWYERDEGERLLTNSWSIPECGEGF